MLRELTLWLTAGALNVRAEGSLRFPERQDISELRLSFIRVAPEGGRIKLMLISLSPLASGLAALWAISAALFPVSGSMLPAPPGAPGSVTELGAAITSLTQTANFWLWLYIVFTIANCSFPALAVKLSAAGKVLPLLALLAICFGTWRAFNTANPAVALAIEGLLRGLTLIVAQVTLLNISCVLVLGTLEAAIERISSRSATFRDGRLITLDGSESATGPASARPQPAAGSAAPQAAPAKSIYDLRLPIPGPPGREPISRQAVAVVNMMDKGRQAVEDSVKDQALTAPPKSPRAAEPGPSAIDDSARQKPNMMGDEVTGEPRPGAADHDTAAPFARPFAAQESPAGAADDWLEAPAEVDGEPFARPFVMNTSSDQPAAGEAFAVSSDLSEADATDISAANKPRSSAATRDGARRGASQTRPAPKPSKKERSAGGKDATESGELEYEDLDEFDNFDRDDGFYDDDV